MHFILFCAICALLLPFEMYIWGTIFDSLLIDSYFSRRIQLSVFWELPSWVLFLIGGAALCCILCAFSELYKKSHKKDFLLLYGIPLLVAVMLLYKKLPCAAAIGVPLFVLGILAAWFTKPSEERQPFLLSGNLQRCPVLSERFRALFLIFSIQSAGSLLLQQGFNLWFSSAVYYPLLLLPFSGCLLKSTGKIRKYISGSTTALFLCGFFYFTTLVITNCSFVLDLSIIFTYLFFEVELMILLRRFFPETSEQSSCSGKKLAYWLFRNISIIICVFCMWFTQYIMPPVCSFCIVPLGAYILFILIENSKTIYRKLFIYSRCKTYPSYHVSQMEYTALGWGLGFMLAAWFIGPSRLLYVVACFAAILTGTLIRMKYMNNHKGNHVILQNFPYCIELIFLLAVILILSAGSKEQTVILICICACASALMQTVWNAGSIWERTKDSCFGSVIFQTLSYGGTCFLLGCLFYFRAPASLFFGVYLILLGFIRIGAASYRNAQCKKSLTAGWLLVLAGQIITMIPPKIILPRPVWDRRAVLGGAVLFVLFYISNQILSQYHNRKLNNEKEN